MADRIFRTSEAARQRGRLSQERYRRRCGVTAPGVAHCCLCGAEFSRRTHNAKSCDSCRPVLALQNKAASSRRCRRRKAAPLYCEICKRLTPRTGSRQRVCAECRDLHKLRMTLDWQRRAPDAVRAIRSRHYTKARQDPGKRLHANISSSIRTSLKRKHGKAWQVLVGFSLDDLKQHLERQFRPGMSWANYGSEWEVDHIIPRSAFNFSSSTDADFAACWALSNLRPLWRSENRQKSGKRALLL